jgi:PhnB protein
MPDQNALEKLLAERLRDMPTEAFRILLLEELMEAATPTIDRVSYRPPGFRSVAPYLMVPRAHALIGFFERVFGAYQVQIVPRPDGTVMHCELRIGDSVVELADESVQYPAILAALHLYVPDADDTYARALEAGATSLFEPGDRPYGDREAGIKDPSGNTWYIATHKLRPGAHVPEGLGTVTPYLHVNGASQFLAYIVDGLGGEVLFTHPGPDGRVMHAKFRLGGDAVIECSDGTEQWPAMPGSLHFYVPDADAAYERAIAAGGTSIHAPATHPYGERSGGVLDPFGNKWWIATYLGNR